MAFKTWSPHDNLWNFSLSFQIQQSSDLPEGATVPALGLSNKAVFEGMANKK